MLPTNIAPNITSLADGAVVLDSCYTVCPRTTQSFGSLMTGLVPANHGAFGLFHDLPGDVTTLAEILQDEGYETSAVVTNFFLQRGRGFEQGFTDYDDGPHHAGLEIAEEVTDRISILTTLPPDGPFFLWAHFLDPHWPYTPPPTIARSLHEEYDRPFTLYADIDSGLVSRGEVIFSNSMDRLDRRHMQRLYLGEVNYVDAHIGRLLGLLDMNGYLDNTIVIFYSDHGESLGEHEYFYAHGERLYQPTLHIPAMIYFPGELEPGRFDGLMDNTDLFATVLELMGLPVPDGIDGKSMANAIRNNGESPRSVCRFESDYQLIYEENAEFHYPGPEGKWRGVLAEGHKLIRVPNPDGDTYELYDLNADPFELTNVIDEKPEMTERLREELREWEAVLARETAQESTIDEETSHALRSLGYLN